MKVLIKNNPVATSLGGKTSEFLKDYAGKWVEIDTTHLFNNQYNTFDYINSDGVMMGYRLYDSMIEAIENDARHGKGKCTYCGAMKETGETCSNHIECITFGIKWFTPENTFFLKYPSGLKNKPIDPIKIGTYSLEFFESLGYYRLRNCRKTINFKYLNNRFYIANGIGYEAARMLDVPFKVYEKLIKVLG